MKNYFDTLYCFFVQHIGIRVGDFLFKQNILERIQYLRKAQYMPLDKLEEEKAKLLKILIKTSYNEVPFYKELFDKYKIKPEEINSPNDLNKIPIVTKDLLRENYPAKTVRKTGLKTYENLTSGSTGKNFVVLEDIKIAGLNRAAFILMLEWAGWKIGEKHFQTGMTLNRGFLKKVKDVVFRCEYASAYDLKEDNLDRYLEIIERKKIRHIFGYPGSLYFLAKRAKELGWNTPMKAVVTWGDTLEDKARRLIEEVFQKQVTDAYGCGEGIQVACQCEKGSYHIFSLDTIVEIVDDNGEILPPGEMGNIILTRLHPGPMPLIRYRVGDRGILDCKSCECGRTWELLKGLRGREADEIITPSGNKLIVHFFTGILEHFKEIDEFQVVQKKENLLIIKIVPSKPISEELKSKIIEKLKEHGADDMVIQIEIVKEIPLEKTGKRKFVIKDYKN